MERKVVVISISFSESEGLKKPRTILLILHPRFVRGDLELFQGAVLGVSFL